MPVPVPERRATLRNQLRRPRRQIYGPAGGDFAEIVIGFGRLGGLEVGGVRTLAIVHRNLQSGRNFARNIFRWFVRCIDLEIIFDAVMNARELPTRQAD